MSIHGSKTSLSARAGLALRLRVSGKAYGGSMNQFTRVRTTTKSTQDRQRFNKTEMAGAHPTTTGPIFEKHRAPRQVF